MTSEQIGRLMGILKVEITKREIDLKYAKVDPERVRAEESLRYLKEAMEIADSIKPDEDKD